MGADSSSTETPNTPLLKMNSWVQVLFVDDYRHPGRVRSDLDNGVDNLAVQAFTIQLGNDVETIT
jgi:hypothetical protein